MELQCDICFHHFDVESHRPKGLPCGHTICKECVMNPELGRKCPTCRKDLPGEPDDIPDNILAIQLIENGGAPPCKRRKREETEVQQLQRGVDAGRKLVEALRLAVPKAVEALNRQLDESIEQLRQLEEALEQHVQLGATGDEGTLPVEQLQLAMQMEDSLNLLNTNKCGIVAEEEDGSTWKASVQLDGFGNILHPLLLQLREDGQLQKVDPVGVAATPVAYVGPPTFPTLSIVAKDLHKGHLKVDEILRDVQRWSNVRAITGLQGEDSDKLLRVLAPHLPHLEELDIWGVVQPGVMEEVEKLSSLRRLKVWYDSKLVDYPDLPLQLEELFMASVRENQLRRVLTMPRLRSLYVDAYRAYTGPNVTFSPSQHGRLLWLRVALHSTNKLTLLSFISAFAASLLQLHVYSPVNNKEESKAGFYHPDLGQDLAACGLRVLKRLVLERPSGAGAQCSEVAACLLQRRTIRGALPSSVEVVCGSCHTSLS